MLPSSSYSSSSSSSALSLSSGSVDKQTNKKEKESGPLISATPFQPYNPFLRSLALSRHTGHGRSSLFSLSLSSLRRSSRLSAVNTSFSWSFLGEFRSKRARQDFKTKMLCANWKMLFANLSNKVSDYEKEEIGYLSVFRETKETLEWRYFVQQAISTRFSTRGQKKKERKKKKKKEKKKKEEERRKRRRKLENPSFARAGERESV